MAGYGPTYSTYNITATGTTGYSAAKDPSQTATLLTLSGTYASVAFTVEGTPDGTNWFPLAVRNNSTNLVITGATTISPSDNAEVSWTVLNVLGMQAVRTNVSSYGSGTGVIQTFSSTGDLSPNVTVSSSTGVFTNITASGTLDVTGLSTFTGGTVVPDNATMAFGTGSDLLGSWDGTRFSFTQAATNSEMRYGVDGAGIDQTWYGDTASTSMKWDQSADSLILTGVAPLVFTGTTGQPAILLTDNLADALSVGISGSTDLIVLTTTDNAESVSLIGVRNRQATAVAITGATTLKLSDSGGIFTVGQGSAYDIDLPSPTSGANLQFTFQLVSPGANNVTITVAGGAATFEGTIVNDVTSVVPATGSTLTFASGTAALGDNIEVISTATGKYFVRAVSSAAGGITIA